MENVRPLRTPRPARRPGNRRWLRILVFAAIPVLLIATNFLRWWVDLLWFDELGQQDVMLTRLQWGAIVGIASGLVAFALTHLNLSITRRVAKNDLYVPFLAGNVDPDAPEQPVVPHWAMKPILLGASLLVGLISCVGMWSQWETVLRWTGRTSFGVDDPLFGRDASFYVFTMPLLELIGHALQVLLILIILTTALSYVATGVIRYTPLPRIARPAATHLAMLGGVFLLLEAYQYRLRIWNLVTSAKGREIGAGFTDATARRPAFFALILLSILAAALVIWFARSGRWRNLGYVVGGWVAVTVLLTGIVPALVQSVVVEPNELQRERKVIEGNIELTREAFGLSEFRKQQFADKASLTPADFTANTGTTSNLRLWSPGVLQQVLTQRQQFQQYYEFRDVDVDRYTIDGKYQQVMLSVRELKAEEFPTSSWTSERLFYTHGFGAVAAWPNRTTENGLPELLLQDIPPKPNGQKSLKLDEPAVYFGEESPDRPVIVNTKQDEFDYPEKDKSVKSRYEGDGGIQIGGFIRRVALAATFADGRLLWTSQITGKSRYMYRRNINERIHTLAPFLTIDRDPYAVIHEGRLVWMVDLYTTTDRFPYSDFRTAQDGTRINYVRNSVKATVDAYNGDVKMYVVDKKDPLLRAWRKIHPGLFEDGSKMPKGLQEHMRYPEDLFEWQTDKYLRYHVDDAESFFNSSDLWNVPQVRDEQARQELAQKPFYVLAKLPNEAKEEMLLVRPLVPNKRKNLIAYMVARMDPGHYGEVFTLTLSKQSLTQGPQQIQARIKQEPEIRQQLTLWRGSGDTEPLMGDLLVLPVKDSLLYVQPVYLVSEEAQQPEFQRVVVALGEDIAWGETFDEAVQNLQRKQRDGASEDEEPASDGTSPDGDGGGDDSPSPPADTSNLSEAEMRRTLEQIGEHYDRAIECQQDGDWECYGREIDEIDRLLGRSR